jgi:hypothetical protein
VLSEFEIPLEIPESTWLATSLNLGRKAGKQEGGSKFEKFRDVSR